VSLSANGETLAIGEPRFFGAEPGRVRVFRYDIDNDSWEPYGSPINGIETGGKFVMFRHTYFRLFTRCCVPIGSIGVALEQRRDGGDRCATGSGRSRTDACLQLRHERVAAAWSRHRRRVERRLFEQILGSFFCNSLSALQTRLLKETTNFASAKQQGYAVALSGDATTVVIGALENSEAGNLAGHARVFRYTGGAWTQLGDDIDGEAADDLSVIRATLLHCIASSFCCR
jgi:hypothetical protein